MKIITKTILVGIITTAILSLTAAISMAQFPFNIGGAGNNTTGNGIVRDANNNVYVTGDFGGTADFDPSSGTANLTSAGSNDIFVAKYNASGVYQWAFNIGGTKNDVSYGMAIDADNNLYITGSFAGTADFDPSGATANLVSNGSSDIFVAKYDSSGNYQWAFSIGSTAADIGYAIATDAAGNVLITGKLAGTADFDPAGGTHNPSSVLTNNAILFDAFVAKYDASGAYQWAFNVGDGFYTFGAGIATDAANNVLVTGLFAGTPDFNPSAAPGDTAYLTTSSLDYFVAKYDASGTYQWAFNLNNGNAQAQIYQGIATDANNNVVITGGFNGTADFKGTSPVSYPISSVGGNNDIFVAKYDASGAYQWAFNIGNGDSICNGQAITTDATGNILVTGNFAGTIDFDPSGSTANLSGVLQNDVFVAKYNSSGIYQWALDIGSVNGDNAVAISTDAGGNVLVTGGFDGTADFDPSAGTANLTPLGLEDAFVAKYTSGGALFGSCSANVGSDQSICQGSNATATLGAVTVSGDTYNWSPATGLSSDTVSQPTASPSITTTYTLTETNTSSGCHATDSVVVSVNSSPSTPVISASGPTTFCTGESVTLNSGSGYSTYLWSNGESTQSIDVATQGSYSVTVTNSPGCSAESSITDVMVNPLPPTPSINQNGDTLISSLTAGGYQWYLEGSLISGATDRFYLPVQNGNYTISIEEGGCSSTSATFNYVATNVNALTTTNASLLLYPIPASDYFNVESKTTALQSVIIYDVLGKKVLSTETGNLSAGAGKNKLTINIETLPQGVYLVQLKTNGTVSALRLIKEE